MTTGTKKRKTEGLLRQVVAANVTRLIELRFADDEEADKYRTIAQKVGCSASTVERISKAQVGTSLDTLESLADYFQIMPYQLLIPMLDAKNPQIIRGALEGEREFYKNLLKSQPTKKG